KHYESQENSDYGLHCSLPPSRFCLPSDLILLFLSTRNIIKEKRKMPRIINIRGIFLLFIFLLEEFILSSSLASNSLSSLKSFVSFDIFSISSIFKVPSSEIVAP